MGKDKLKIISGVINVVLKCGFTYPWIKPHKDGVFAAAEKEHSKKCKKCPPKIKKSGVA